MGYHHQRHPHRFHQIYSPGSGVSGVRVVCFGSVMAANRLVALKRWGDRNNGNLNTCRNAQCRVNGHHLKRRVERARTRVSVCVHTAHTTHPYSITIIYC